MNITKRNILFTGIVEEERVSQSTIEVETVLIAELTDHNVSHSATEEMENLLDYAEVVISAGTHDVPKDTDPIEFLIKSAKYN